MCPMKRLPSGITYYAPTEASWSDTLCGIRVEVPATGLLS